MFKLTDTCHYIVIIIFKLERSYNTSSPSRRNGNNSEYLVCVGVCVWVYVGVCGVAGEEICL